MEVWKDIQGYEGLYQISNTGKVKRNNKILKFSIAKGYEHICLYKNNKYKPFSVHRLVAEAFIPNPENKPQIDHIDGNPLNNKVDNLRWATAKENIANPITMKRKSVAAMGNHMTGRFGALHHNSKRVQCIETKTVYYGFAEASRKTGINAFGISMATNGKRTTAGGYHWQYI